MLLMSSWMSSSSQKLGVNIPHIKLLSILTSSDQYHMHPYATNPATMPAGNSGGCQSGSYTKRRPRKTPTGFLLIPFSDNVLMRPAPILSLKFKEPLKDNVSTPHFHCVGTSCSHTILEPLQLPVTLVTKNAHLRSSLKHSP